MLIEILFIIMNYECVLTKKNWDRLMPDQPYLKVTDTVWYVNSNSNKKTKYHSFNDLEHDPPLTIGHRTDCSICLMFTKFLNGTCCKF